MVELLSTHVELTILKPVAEVFAAVITPVPYFAESVSSPMEQGKTVRLKFPEMTTLIEMKVLEVVPNKRIRIEWDSGLSGNNTCDLKFDSPHDLNPAVPPDKNTTTLSITESGWPATSQGRDFSYRNTIGWTHMACALKAYLEYGVNLRKGSFLHMKF